MGSQLKPRLSAVCGYSCHITLSNPLEVANAVSLPRKYVNRSPRYWRGPRRFFSPFGDQEEISKRRSVRTKSIWRSCI